MLEMSLIGKLLFIELVLSFSPLFLWGKTLNLLALDSCGLSILTFTLFCFYHLLDSWSVFITCCTHWVFIPTIILDDFRFLRDNSANIWALRSFDFLICSFCPSISTQPPSLLSSPETAPLLKVLN